MSKSTTNGNRKPHQRTKKQLKSGNRPKPKRASTKAQLRQFVNCLFEPNDLIELRLLSPGNLPSVGSKWQRAQDLPGSINDLVKANQDGQQIYFGANPRKRRGGKTDDVKFARSLFADFDNNMSEAQVRKLLRESGFRAPTVMINSGHGIHCYWLLERPLKDMKRWRLCQKRIIQLFGSDPKICDPPRIMRLPGFMNHKKPLAEATLIDASPHNRYSLEELETLLPVLQTSLACTTQPRSPVQRSGEHENTQPMNRNQRAYLDGLEDRAIAYLAKCEPSISGQYGHDKAYYAARIVVYGFDLGVERGLRILLEHFNPGCQPRWSETELRHKCQDADTQPFDRPRGWLIRNEPPSKQQPDEENGEKLDSSCQSSQNSCYADLWNARRLVRQHGVDLRYVSAWKKWITWDGHRWNIDENGETMRRAKTIVDQLQAEATQEEMSDE